MPVFKYAKGSEPKDKRVPEDSEKTKEVRKERADKNQPAPAEKGTNTYEEGDSEGGGKVIPDSSGSRVSGGSFRS